MQVPVVMTTSLGQKISTVAVQQPTGPTGAAGHTALLTNSSAISAAAGNTNSQQKVRGANSPVCTGPYYSRVSALRPTYSIPGAISVKPCKPLDELLN